MDEFMFIHSIKQGSYKQPSLIKGIGDDAAVFRSTNEDIVSAVDTFVDTIHFSQKTMGFYHIGYRALAANIRDMAAMGAKPNFYLVSIVIPKDISKQQLQSLYTGMEDIALTYHMDLIGGDTVSGEQLTLSISIIGSVPREKARYRSDAKPDDIVFVTGTLGDSRAGLHVLQQDLHINNRDYFIQRHQMPKPRVDFAKSVQNIKRMALNDISDGIASELREIAEASNVGITINDEQVPLHKSMSQFTQKQQNEWKYYGGEDFELVGTVAKKDWKTVKKRAEELKVQITEIGEVTGEKEKSGKVFVNKDNKIHSLKKRGYSHKVGE